MTIMQILVAARWAHFIALFVLFGAPLSCLLARGVKEQDAQIIFRRTDRLLQVLAVIAAASGLVWIAALIANMAGSFADAATAETLRAFFFKTQFGPVVIIRLILLATIVLAIALPLRLRLSAWLLLAGGLLIDQAWLGHAANGGATLFGALVIAVYSVHVLAGAAWVGGLPVILFTLFLPIATEQRTKILLRFSALATVAVILIITTGVANALFRVHGQGLRLIGTNYGNLLMIKIALVMLMLILAAYNRLIALPRLGKPSLSAVNSTLTLSIAVELALGALVIGVAALLGVTPPPA